MIAQHGCFLQQVSESLGIWLKTDKVHAFRRKKYHGFFLGKLSYNIMKTVACTGFWLLAFVFDENLNFSFQLHIKSKELYQQYFSTLNKCPQLKATMFLLVIIYFIRYICSMF